MDDKFSLPFERAFKRLRVNGDELSIDKSENLLTRKIDNSLTKTDNAVSSSNAESIMWRSNDKPEFAEINSLKTKHIYNSLSTSISSNQEISEKLTSNQASPFNQSKSNNLRSSTNFETRLNSVPLNGLKKSNAKFQSTSNTELTQNCSHQARNESDITVDELAGYLDLQLYLPRTKMSFMAEMAYS